MVVWTVLLTGCQGCRHALDLSTTDNAAGRSAVSGQAFKPFPAAEATGQSRVKPGHWFTATKPLQSNREDRRGTLEIVAGHSRTNDEGKRTDVVHPVYSQRPAVLPHGQRKRLDFRLLAPLADREVDRAGFLRARLATNREGLVYDSGRRDLGFLRPEQYFFVVLTSRPERFVALQTADWVKPPPSIQVLETGGETPVHFRLVFPPASELVSLPETMLDWTSIAYILWDDISVDRLTSGQRRALQDWLHWGGRLIVNGRHADRILTDSSLAALLPLVPEGLGELDREAFATMLRQCSVVDDDSTGQRLLALAGSSGQVALEGRVAPSAQEVAGTAGLVWERRCGLGQIVMTRFDVTTDLLAQWRSRDSFQNSIFLRRPPRRYELMRQANRLVFDQAVGSEPLPLLNSSVRLFSRDGRMRIAAPLPRDPAAPGDQQDDVLAARNVASPRADSNAATGVAARPPTMISPLAAWYPDGVVSESRGGVAAWTDRSPLARLALAGLASESGIEIPPAGFVAKSLAWYLMILGPVNFCIFRILRRPGFAWLAVPIIAIGGAIAVARQARLDIGFNRLQNEISVFELQPQYDRAHLTSYVAVYSSLGTEYEVRFDTSDAVALPVMGRNLEFPDDRINLRFGDGGGVHLSGLFVPSNRTRLIHAEQIVSLGGSLHWDQQTSRLTNRTTVDLRHLVLLDKSSANTLRFAGLDQLSSGGGADVQFTDIPPSLPAAISLTVRSIVEGLAADDQVPTGQTRLIAIIQDPPSEMKIQPAANQSRRAGVLLAHLQHPSLPDATQDKNLPPIVPTVDADQ